MRLTVSARLDGSSTVRVGAGAAAAAAAAAASAGAAAGAASASASASASVSPTLFGVTAGDSSASSIEASDSLAAFCVATGFGRATRPRPSTVAVPLNASPVGDTSYLHGGNRLLRSTSASCLIAESPRRVTVSVRSPNVTVVDSRRDAALAGAVTNAKCRLPLTATSVSSSVGHPAVAARASASASAVSLVAWRGRPPTYSATGSPNSIDTSESDDSVDTVEASSTRSSVRISAVSASTRSKNSGPTSYTRLMPVLLMVMPRSLSAFSPSSARPVFWSPALAPASFPARCRRASARVVLPWSTCAMMDTLRVSIPLRRTSTPTSSSDGGAVLPLERHGCCCLSRDSEAAKAAAAPGVRERRGER
mmetsp:Transcript_34971/g.91549  ORF Transcript_34971/g.91549 Transcript_34971/m.91549 type:complete len:365 (-) Transcript_34971:207-1301(-)